MIGKVTKLIMIHWPIISCCGELHLPSQWKLETIASSNVGTQDEVQSNSQDDMPRQANPQCNHVPRSEPLEGFSARKIETR
jgi:hypothetical protein